MNIEIKKSINPVKYGVAVQFLEERLLDIYNNKKDNLIWLLEHEEIYTAGTNYKEEEILNKNINLIKTNRGGKITYHGPGQLICYFVIDLKQRNKDIRKFITLLEKTIIESLSEFNIKSFGDPKNIGIWVNDKNNIKKVAAIGVRVSKWIAYHGFAININNDLKKYQNIIPCGISDKGVTNLKSINNQSYNILTDVIVENFTKNLEISVF
jgi:lipoyl(octanoyl) transferase